MISFAERTFLLLMLHCKDTSHSHEKAAMSIRLLGLCASTSSDFVSQAQALLASHPNRDRVYPLLMKVGFVNLRVACPPEMKHLPVIVLAQAYTNT